MLWPVLSLELNPTFAQVGFFTKFQQDTTHFVEPKISTPKKGLQCIDYSLVRDRAEFHVALLQALETF